MGIAAELDLQARVSLLAQLRRIVHGAVLLLVSYLSIPLFLGLFSPPRPFLKPCVARSMASSPWWRSRPSACC